MKKHPFLVLYDYGMGGVWAVIHADEKSQISQKYPWLSVVEARPSWMTEQEYQKILSTLSFDIDEPPRGWLLSAASEQGNRP